MKSVLLINFEKLVADWHGLNGVGKEAWYVDVNFMNLEIDITSITNIKETIIDYLKRYSLPVEFVRITDKGKMQLSRIENRNGLPLNIEEQDDYEKGQLQMYFCEYNVSVLIQKTITEQVGTQELKHMFPE